MSLRPEQIPYGVQDFKRIRLEGRYYVDKTVYIRRSRAGRRCTSSATSSGAETSCALRKSPKRR